MQAASRASSNAVLQRQCAQVDDGRESRDSGSRTEKGAQGRRVIMRAGMGQERKVAPSRFRQGLRGRLTRPSTHRRLLEDTAATPVHVLQAGPMQRLRITAACARPPTGLHRLQFQNATCSACYCCCVFSCKAVCFSTRPPSPALHARRLRVLALAVTEPQERLRLDGSRTTWHSA